MSAVRAGWCVKNNPLGGLDFKLRGDWLSTYSITGAAASTVYALNQWTQTITWGNIFDATFHGIQTTIATNSPKPLVPGDTGLYTITFHVPVAWSATDTVVTANSFLSASNQLIEIDNWLLVGDCDSWTATFDEIRWYVGGVLKKTIGAQTQSGSGYDDRLCVFSNQVRADSNPSPVIPPPVQSCNATYATQVVQKIDSTVGVTAGWEWYNGSSWIADDIVILSLDGPEPTDCADCTPTLAGFPYTNSWDQGFSSELYFEDTAVDKGNQNCTCDDGAGTPAVRHFWTTERRYRATNTRANVVRKDAPERVHIESITDHCNGVDTPDATTVADLYAVSECYQEARKAYYFRTCSSSVSPGSCHFGVGNTCPSFGPDVTCHEELEINVYWPEMPPCSDGSKHPFIVQDDMGRLHQAYISAGDVWYRRSDDTRSADAWGGMNVQVTARGDVRKAHFDYDTIYKRVELYFETTSHDVYYTYSKGDEGATWHTAASVGSNMIDFFTATNHYNDDRFRCWFEYDAGTSGPGKAKGQYRRYSESSWSATFTFKNGGVALSIADGGMCNVAPAFSNQGEWTFSPVIDGDTLPTTWFSNDEGRTWRLQP